ncbi:hypothetical protein MSPP1_002578 [Malassezia sp. CBS 17886]|nr:hypothetical protein MSPP1_002578 [Malassezia sp. CBS 17886]
MARNVRMYDTDGGPVPSTGATATSTGWRNREQADENMYMIEQEKKKLEKMRSDMRDQEAKVEGMKKDKK